MRRRNSFLGLLAILLSATLFSSLGADVIIHLKNGDRVTGTIASETATDVTLQTGALGKITIPVGQIAKREAVVPPAAATTNAPPVAATVSTNKPAAPPVAVKPPEPKHWNSEIQLGLNLRYSAKDQQEGLVIAKSTYAKNRFREIVDYNFTYGQTEKVETANKMIGSSKTEFDLSPKVYSFGLAGAFYDRIRLIDRQYELNPGIGYTWFKKPDFVLKNEVGFGYQNQLFRGGREVETYSARLAAISTWRIYDKLMEDTKLEFFPNVKSIEDYRLRLESTLRYPLNKNLSLNLIVVDLYDTQTPPGVQHNDLQVRSALGIKF